MNKKLREIPSVLCFYFLVVSLWGISGTHHGWNMLFRKDKYLKELWDKENKDNTCPKCRCSQSKYYDLQLKEIFCMVCEEYSRVGIPLTKYAEYKIDLLKYDEDKLNHYINYRLMMGDDGYNADQIDAMLIEGNRILSEKRLELMN